MLIAFYTIHFQIVPSGLQLIDLQLSNAPTLKLKSAPTFQASLYTLDHPEYLPR